MDLRVITSPTHTPEVQELDRCQVRPLVTWWSSLVTRASLTTSQHQLWEVLVSLTPTWVDLT